MITTQPLELQILSVLGYKGIAVFKDRRGDLCCGVPELGNQRETIKIVWGLHQQGLARKRIITRKPFIVRKNKAPKTYTLYSLSPKGREFLRELGL